jgi:hypothetical protein
MFHQILTTLSPICMGVDIVKHPQKYGPALKMVLEHGSKAVKLVRDHLPKVTKVWQQYSDVSSALDHIRKGTPSYEAKRNGARFFGFTSEKIGYLYNQKGESWDLFNPKFDTSSPEHISGLLKQVFVHTESNDLLQLRVAQILAKILMGNCSRKLQKGFEIEIPVVNSANRRELVKYTIDTKFDLGKGIPAFGLVDPKGRHAPLLIFRPTNLEIQYVDSIFSLIANLNPKGPAHTEYTQSKSKIESWLKRVTNDGQNKARVMGYSQGGMLASYVLTYQSKWISASLDRPSFILDSPGLSFEVAKDWNRMQKKPHVWSFVMRGDLIPKLGNQLIGKVFEIETTEKMSAVQSHKAVASLARRWKIREVDVDEENRSDMRKSFAKVQKVATDTLYSLLQNYLASKLK